MQTENPRIVAIIPARGGSKGIPGKNIKSLCGKPLIAYSIETAQQSRLVDAVAISTDSEEIAGVARSYGGDVPFLRPAEFAQDNSPDSEFLIHAVEWLEQNRNWTPEIIVLLQPTSPSRTAEDIDVVLQQMIDTDADSAKTVIHGGAFNPYKMWIDRGGKFMEPLFPENLHTPRQQLPEYYVQIGLVYATKTSFIKSGEIWGPKVACVPVSADKLTDLDEPEDWTKAEAIMKSYNS